MTRTVLGFFYSILAEFVCVVPECFCDLQISILLLSIIQRSLAFSHFSIRWIEFRWPLFTYYSNFDYFDTFAYILLQRALWTEKRTSEHLASN